MTLTFCSSIVLSAALITDLLHNTVGPQQRRFQYICILRDTSSSQLKTCFKRKRNFSDKNPNDSLHFEIYILYSSGDWCFIKLWKFSWSKRQQRVLQREIYCRSKITTVKKTYVKNWRTSAPIAIRFWTCTKLQRCQSFMSQKFASHLRFQLTMVFVWTPSARNR